MLEWFADAPDPDAGLFGFRRISESLGSAHWYLKTLRDEARWPSGWPGCSRRRATPPTCSSVSPRVCACSATTSHRSGPRSSSNGCARRQTDRRIRRKRSARSAPSVAASCSGSRSASCSARPTSPRSGSPASHRCDARATRSRWLVVRCAHRGLGDADPDGGRAMVDTAGSSRHGSDADVMFVHDPSTRPTARRRRRAHAVANAASAAARAGTDLRWSSTPTCPGGSRVTRAPPRVVPRRKWSSWVREPRPCYAPMPWSVTSTLRGFTALVDRCAIRQTASPRPT